MNKNLTQDPAIHVGVVDDHLDELKGIKTTFIAHSGPETLKKLSEEVVKPDIILMDVNMPDMNGIEVTKQITVLYPAIKVVALSASGEENTILKMFGAGACAYLVKSIQPSTLEQAIHEVYRKGKYYADILHLYQKERVANENTELKIKLNQKELEVLICMRTGYTIDETARSMSISASRVKYYRVSLGDKFKTKSHVIIVVNAIRKGILMLDAEC